MSQSYEPYIEMRLAIFRTEMATVISDSVAASSGQAQFVGDRKFDKGYYPAGSGDYSKWRFGFTINPDGDNPAEIDVKAGDIQWGKTTITIADTRVVIASNATYVGLECNGSTASIVTSTSITDVTSDNTYLRTWLHKWDLVDGKATMTTLGHLGNIINPSTYATPVS
jgi:hypothetical protein